MNMRYFITLCYLLLSIYSSFIHSITNHKNYYKTLDISPTANENDIKKAYRKLAMKVRIV